MAFGMFFSMGKRHDYRNALYSVDAPVLIVHGEKDIQPEDVSFMYHKYFVNSKVRTIENAGLFPFYDQPDEFAATIAGFLKRNGI